MRVASAKRPGEFELIRRYFAPLAAATPGALGLGDDVALLTPRAGTELVLKTDGVVGGVHFLTDDPPDQIARKALRVNLSDLAAKGAAPLGYLMTCALDASVDEPWIASFCAGLAADQAEFGIGLLGGDTMSTPGPVSISIMVLGEVPIGRVLRRNAAKPGDLVFVSGTLGDAVLGLKRLRGRFPAMPKAESDHLIDRYRLPQPRLRLGRALLEEGLARASLDISDGLIADLGHVGEQSGLAAEVERDRLPLSPAAARALDEDPALIVDIVAGGDDYELLFTAPAAARATLADLGRRLNLRLTEVGRMIEPSGSSPGTVRLLDGQGREIPLARRGWEHF
ncbi:MAG TPA: thiamine-phosphate kinase [Hypericibacter adhaerens]|uniref:thiamine-phosphate kinase n=1 Tax=Hypericibacter adhaerens TaxID=2602016 RepID=UPI002C4CA666|nr:thiamine-phosphate kinase [Hypericibacter adhaerens]HWA42894.1 thiamine-phosphate kinase [Hypericibacter adhaerens]